MTEADDGPVTTHAAAAGAASIDPRYEAELRRGVLQLVALHLLAEPRYGYELVRSLGEAGFAVEEGTLYPLLRRFERDGLVSSRWSRRGSRPRKYYVIAEEGKARLARMRSTWQDVARRTSLALASLAPTATDSELEVAPLEEDCA